MFTQSQQQTGATAPTTLGTQDFEGEFPELTERERQVAIRIARGSTNREISDELGFSLKTYDTHRQHILKKLALRHNVELCLLAVKRGYIDPNGGEA